MNHLLEDNDDLESYLTGNLFPSIKRGEVTLFLGAGSSATEMQFLGRQIIDYYEDKLGVQLGINDLIEFTDIISSNPKFDRNDFDNYIVSILSKISPSETHKIIAGANWNQIITTNVDLVIERAFDSISNTYLENKTLRLVRNTSESYMQLSNANMKYVKLNGCISNKSKYPLVFSSKDFSASKKFHSSILKSLSDLPPEGKFITIGYSFTDHVSRHILKHFDSFNFRYKKPIICFDPYIQEGRLDYLKDQSIYVVKLDIKTLFERYKSWEESAAASVVARKSIVFKNVRNEPINIPSKLKLALGTNIIQLCETSKIASVNPALFYQGEKPTYDVVRKNTDVIKAEKIKEVKDRILEIVDQNVDRIVPVIYLTGSFGTGKSTFAYRLLYELTQDVKLLPVAFEFQDLSLLRSQDCMLWRC